jgi:prepilin-type N-terminal cleavage/methylation domain-containing protein
LRWQNPPNGGGGNYKVSSTGSTRAHRKAGFTLVEVIVVIVIIAILAAIGVPALTGYIDKAQDKKYIAMARNYYVAAKTVLTEAYSDDEFTTEQAQSYFKTGTKYPPNNTSNTDRTVSFDILSNYTTGSSETFNRRAFALVGEEAAYPNTTPGYRYINFVFPEGTSVLNSDAFYFFYAPDGVGSGKPLVAVTCNLAHVDIAKNGTKYPSNNVFSGAYDPDAGYEVYYMIRQ